MAESDEEYKVVRCWGCEKIFDQDDAAVGFENDEGEYVLYDEPKCPFCGVAITADGTEVKTIAF